MCYDNIMIKLFNSLNYLLISLVLLVLIGCNSNNSIESSDAVRTASFAPPVSPALMKSASFESSDSMIGHSFIDKLGDLRVNSSSPACKRGVNDGF